MNKLLIFLAGAAVGGTGVYFYVKKKYEQYADEEIASVVDRFKEREKELEEKADIYKKSVEDHIEGKTFEDLAKERAEKKAQEEDEEELITDENIIDDLGYSNKEKGPVGSKPSIAPYVITEEEFGEFGNEEKTLLYYQDDVLADDEDIMVEDKFTTVGDALEEFIKDPYCERVYVRDEGNEIDYIILRSDKNYTDLIKEEDN